MRRDVLLLQHDPLLDRVLGEGNAVTVIDVGDHGRLVVLERAHNGNADGASQHETSGNAEKRDAEEDEDPAFASASGSGRSDDLAGHAGNSNLSCRGDAAAAWFY